MTAGVLLGLVVVELPLIALHRDHPPPAGEPGMSDAFWVSYVLLWVLVVGLLGLVLLLYRQFGMSYLAPHAQVSMQGLDVGSRAPAVALEGLDGEERGLTWGGSPNGLRARLMLFALPSCSICVDLAGELQTLPDQWPGVEFAWVDGSAQAAARPAGGRRARVDRRHRARRRRPRAVGRLRRAIRIPRRRRRRDRLEAARQLPS